MNNYPAGVTPEMIEAVHGESAEEFVSCAWCSTESPYDHKDVIEVVHQGKRENTYFCNTACRSRYIFEQTQTLSGKADLMRFVAGLELICETELLHRVPALAEYDADEVQYSNYPTRKNIDIAKFKEMAAALVEMLSPEDSVSWALKARIAVNSISWVEEVSK